MIRPRRHRPRGAKAMSSMTDTGRARPTLLVRLADWSYRRRRPVVLLWIPLLIGTVRAAGSFGGDYHFTFSTPGSDSKKAQGLLEGSFPKRAGADVNVVFHAQQGKTVDDPAVQAAITDILGRFAGQPHVTQVVSPYSPEGARQIAPTRTIAYGTVNLDQSVSDYKTSNAEALLELGKQANQPDLQVELSGFVL